MKKRLLAVFGAAFLCCCIVVTVFAAQAGSQEDPLVSKSYVDNKVTEVLNILNTNAANNNSQSMPFSSAVSPAQLSQIKAEIISELSQNGVSSANEAQMYKPVYASEGQIVLCGEGCEVILRSGKAKVYVTGVAGIVNATTGKELSGGEKADLNNIMIIPRGDGRGFMVTESAWFLIKGDYEIV